MKSLDLCCFNRGRKSNYPEKLLIAYRLAFCFASVLPVQVLGKTKDCHHYSPRCLFPLNLQGILPSLQSHHPAKPLREDVAFNGSKHSDACPVLSGVAAPGTMRAASSVSFHSHRGRRETQQGGPAFPHSW